METKRVGCWILIIIIALISAGLFLKYFPIYHYGYRYNKVRKELGIQEIPNSWEGKWTSNNYILWTLPNNDLRKGYKGKEIKTSYLSIISERDTYYNLFENERILSEYEYGKSIGSRNIKYYKNNLLTEISTIEKDSLIALWQLEPR